MKNTTLNLDQKVAIQMGLIALIRNTRTGRNYPLGQRDLLRNSIKTLRTMRKAYIVETTPFNV